MDKEVKECYLGGLIFQHETWCTYTACYFIHHVQALLLCSRGMSSVKTTEWKTVPVVLHKPYFDLFYNLSKIKWFQHTEEVCRDHGHKWEKSSVLFTVRTMLENPEAFCVVVLALDQAFLDLFFCWDKTCKLNVITICYTPLFQVSVDSLLKWFTYSKYKL